MLYYEFKLMGMSMGEYTIYCSSVRFQMKQFTIFINGYFSETVKTASIITGLLFSIVKYTETSETENTTTQQVFGVKWWILWEPYDLLSHLQFY